MEVLQKSLQKKTFQVRFRTVVVYRTRKNSSMFRRFATWKKFLIYKLSDVRCCDVSCWELKVKKSFFLYQAFWWNFWGCPVHLSCELSAVLGLPLKLKLQARHHCKKSSSAASYKQQHQASYFNLKMRVFVCSVGFAVIQAGKLMSKQSWNKSLRRQPSMDTKGLL